MEKITQSNNLSSLETELFLTKAEMEEFRKLPKEEQEKQKDEKLEKLKVLQEKLDEAIQEAIRTGQLDEVKILKETLSKEVEDLEDVFKIIESEIQVNYTYTNKETGKVERQETIILNPEKKLEEFVSFYKKTNIDLPLNFEDTIRDIWERNKSEIEQSIQEKGFDDLLIIPGNITSAELIEKMKMEDGYHIEINFNEDEGFVILSIDKTRIILFHKKTLPEVQAQTGLDVHLNITAEDALKVFEQNQNEHMTLHDFIVMERKIFEDSNTHISNFVNKSGQWLNTKSATRLVYSLWHPDDHQIDIMGSDHVKDQYHDVGIRPSHIFL